MVKFMYTYGITQAQLSIARNGSQLANYAFNWNDPSEIDVQPDDHFLLASLSKIYCVAAIKTLIARGLLASNTRVYQRLGYTAHDATDARVFDITVEHLLDHLGGDNSAWYGADPAYHMREIAQVMSNGTNPATEREIIEWKLKQQLDFSPGDVGYCRSKNGREFCYSNYGYILLSYLVQNVTASVDYYTWLDANVLQPNGLNVTKWLTDKSYHTNDVVKQMHSCYGYSALDPQSSIQVEGIYGGDGMYKDSDMGGAALATSAAMMTITLSKFPVWGWQTSRAPGSWRDGSTPGAYTYATQRWDGLDVAMMFNTRAFDTDAVNNALYNQIDAVLRASPLI